jgi:pilus assembly protein Flp/PilA
MKNLVSKVKNFFSREDGVTAIEYAVVVAGVAVVVIAVFGTDGPVKQALDNVFKQLQTKLDGLWT